MTEQDQGQNAGGAEVSPGEPERKPETTPQQAAPETKYTEKDVDKLKGAARKEARERAQREFLESLEVESLDDLSAMVSAHRAMEEEISTETDRERKAREKAEKERDNTRSELEEAYSQIERFTKETAMRSALSEEGVNPKRVNAAFRLVDWDAMEVGEDGKLSGIPEQVEAVKTEVPEFFGQYGGAFVPPTPAADSGGLTEQQKADARAAENARTRSIF